MLELIEKIGIHQAIEKSMGKAAKNKDAVAEAIENNVRTTMKSQQANDPAFYGRMSEALDAIISLRKKKSLSYENYLERIAELARQMTQKTDDTTPKDLDTLGKRVLWSNLNGDVSLALKIDATVKQVRPDGWRGVQAKEQLIKAALFGLLQDPAEVERIFPILVAQPEY